MNDEHPLHQRLLKNLPMKIHGEEADQRKHALDRRSAGSTVTTCNSKCVSSDPNAPRRKDHNRFLKQANILSMLLAGSIRLIFNLEFL